jgi:hypothetical protein
VLLTEQHENIEMNLRIKFMIPFMGGFTTSFFIHFFYIVAGVVVVVLCFIAVAIYAASNRM